MFALAQDSQHFVLFTDTNRGQVLTLVYPKQPRLGVTLPAIKRHGRWRSTKTVLEYIEAGRQFADSAVNVLFEF